MIFRQNWQGVRLTDDGEEFFSATVPGNIQADYAVAKGFRNVMFADGFRQFETLENDLWEYRTRLSYNATPDERIWFVSLGIDYRYDIFLNGNRIYRYEGIYKPVELDLTDRLTGNDEIKILVYPHPKREGATAGSREEADHSCKPPVCYGWDWNPRLLISGMWRDAYVETRKSDYIRDCEVFYRLSSDFSRAEVSFAVDCDAECRIDFYDPNGNLLYHGTDKTLTVEHPILWWCAGQGAPNLYRWKVTNPSGMTRDGTVGFRRIRFLRNAGAGENHGFPKSRYQAPFTMELNGRKIFLKGSNFVNPELFWGQATAERYGKLVDLAAEANMNILRLWGGAAVHLPALYERCDERGILVWQEFMLACNNYPDDEKYLSVLESEATAMIRALRHHPCVALWCGGNELFNSWSGMTDQSLALRLLNHLCYTLDRERPFLATSPLEGMGHGGYLFYDSRYGTDVYQCFGNAENTAYTEFGVPSVSATEALKQIIPPEELRELKPTVSWVLHHAFRAWMPESHASLEVLQRYFGADATVEERIAQSDWLQSEGLKFIFEEARRQSPHCSAALNWCFNEPWITAANCSIVRYPDIPKPAYFAVRDALRTALFSAKIAKFDWKAGEVFKAPIWLLNDGPEPIKADAEVFLRIGDREIPLLQWKAAKVDANTNLEGAQVCCVLPQAETDRFVLEIRSSDPRLNNSYCLKYRNEKKDIAQRTMNV
ncbi:MAG: hypothetical protein J5885_03160 [Clostridia bacterium]|nr:hypothetical protein [Clostridia bacterium]